VKDDYNSNTVAAKHAHIVYRHAMLLKDNHQWT